MLNGISTQRGRINADAVLEPIHGLQLPKDLTMFRKFTAVIAMSCLPQLHACGGSSAPMQFERAGGAGGDGAGAVGGRPSSDSGGSLDRGGTGGATSTFVPIDPIDYDGLNGIARNPIVSHVFTADPSAHVFEGRVYVYASHDLDNQTSYAMNDYHVFSSNDLVNWQDHGVVLDAKELGWTNTLYAPDCAFSPITGKYYLYFPNSGSGIGVAVSNSPAGPFEDALGKPLVSRNTPGVSDVEWVFDPACFVDDDGQAYLYFGGGMPNTGDNARVIRLGADMISLADESASTIVAPDFFEASFMHKRNGKYYFSYSTTFTNQAAAIAYLVSDNPTAAFVYKGVILPNPEGNRSNNNHASIVEYEGEWYAFYHSRVLANRDGYSEYQRSITLDRLTYDANGNIVALSGAKGVVRQLRNLDAFARLEAEAIADQRGIEVAFAEESGRRTGVAVTAIQDKDWTGYSQVDFGAGAEGFVAHASSNHQNGGIIHVYVDGCDRFTNLPGTPIGTCSVPNTGSSGTWVDVECNVTRTSGVHDLYLRFEGSDGEPLLDLDYFTFK